MKAVLCPKEYMPDQSRIVYMEVEEAHVQWDGVYLTLKDGTNVKCLLKDWAWIDINERNK